MTQRRTIDAPAKQPGRQPPLITSELIDYHRRRAHRMQSEARRQAISAALRSLGNALRYIRRLGRG